MIDTYNQLGNQLVEAGYIEKDGFYILGTGSEFDRILTKRYEFFQGYLDGPLRIRNAIFIFGSERTYGACAIVSEGINILSINAHVFLGNTLFYSTREKQINEILKKYNIKQEYDLGLDTVSIMRQTSEMYLFYHEVGHLIQAWEPALVSEKISEDNCNTDEFDILDHIAELDADIFANVRIASHIIKIIERGKEQKKEIENICSAIIASYLLYRNLILGNQPEFYTKEEKHPHLLIRMFAAISDVSNSVNMNVDFELDRSRVIELSLKLMDDLCILHPEIKKNSSFTELGQIYLDDIRKYYAELVNLTTNQKGTVYAKRNGYQ